MTEIDCKALVQCRYLSDARWGHDVCWMHSVAQTVGYKMGMIVGGGVLLQIAELTGMAWPGFFVCMAGIIVRLGCTTVGPIVL